MCVCQEIEHMRSEKYKRDKLKQHFFEQGQPMTFNMPRDRREDEPRAEEGNMASSRGVFPPRNSASNEGSGQGGPDGFGRGFGRDDLDGSAFFSRN